MSAHMPERAAEFLRPLMAAHGKLWLPAPAPYVLRLRVKTATRVNIELRSSGSKLRWATIVWNLGTGELRHGSYTAEPEPLEAYRRREISRDEMFRRTRELQMPRVLRALEDLAQREHPLAGLPWCGFCGRGLTDPESIARGIGPECSAKLGIPRNITATGRLASSWLEVPA